MNKNELLEQMNKKKIEEIKKGNAKNKKKNKCC